VLQPGVSLLAPSLLFYFVFIQASTNQGSGDLAIEPHFWLKAFVFNRRSLLKDIPERLI
jgi:hypothetical protein